LQVEIPLFAGAGATTGATITGGAGGATDTGAGGGGAGGCGAGAGAGAGAGGGGAACTTAGGVSAGADLQDPANAKTTNTVRKRITNFFIIFNSYLNLFFTKCNIAIKTLNILPYIQKIINPLNVNVLHLFTGRSLP